MTLDLDNVLIDPVLVLQHLDLAAVERRLFQNAAERKALLILARAAEAKQAPGILAPVSAGCQGVAAE